MSGRILVVEDNRTNLDLMLYLLNVFQHRADGCADGLSGLAAAESGAYDLVLADILMPGIDGYEFARRFKANPSLRETTLVAVTALAMIGDRERALSAGFDGYLTKPIDPERFIADIENLLASRRQSSAPSSHETEPPAPPSDRPAGAVVLVVDDVALNRDVIRGTLSPLGYRVVEAANADEGIALAREVEPALILSDLHMPGGGGFEMIRRTKADARLSSVPFLLMSSTIWQSSDKLRGLEMGAAKFLLRPIDPQQLIDEVESALAQASRGEDPRH